MRSLTGWGHPAKKDPDTPPTLFTPREEEAMSKKVTSEYSDEEFGKDAKKYGFSEKFDKEFLALLDLQN